ncbi:MAG: Inner rane component of cytoplasmic domain [Thermoplasmata archaeon]|jgi:DNA-binding transcriptional ArsR family regulator|nr:Inner rane component of cytoplasmic domain [Thermoplasmata archaeon]
MAEPDVDLERLSAHLRALSHPARLELLFQLRTPRAPADVDVRPRRRDADLSAERTMSRQAISLHLDVLEESGFVNRLDGEGASKFVVSAQRLFAVVEDLRGLTAIEPTMRVDVDATEAEGGAAVSPEWPRSPRLVLLGGPWEGRAFGLDGPGPWSVGRSRQNDITLEYDPFASSRSAGIAREGAAFVLSSEPQARNPARVNFTPVGRGTSVPLRPGDIVGVGRSHLVFQS